MKRGGGGTNEGKELEGTATQSEVTDKMLKDGISCLV